MVTVRLEAKTALNLARQALSLIPEDSPLAGHYLALQGFAHGRLAIAGDEPALNFQAKARHMEDARNRQEIGSDTYRQYGEHEAAARWDLARLAMHPREYPEAASWLADKVASIFTAAGDPMPPRQDQIDSLAYLEQASPPVRIDLDLPKIRGDLFWEFLRYSLVDSEARGNPVTALYRVWADHVEPSERLRLLERVLDAVRHHVASSRSFRVFEEDPDMGIVRIAFRTEALVLPPSPGDMMRGPRLLLETAQATTDSRTRVGIVGGLLALGDARIRPLLHGTWHLIKPEHAPWLWPERGGMIFDSTVGYFLDWIEQYDAVSGAKVLAQMVNAVPDPDVWNVERKLPLQAIDGEPDVRVINKWPLPAYARQLLMRLIDAETSHGSAIHPALEAWRQVAAH